MQFIGQFYVLLWFRVIYYVGLNTEDNHYEYLIFPIYYRKYPILYEVFSLVIIAIFSVQVNVGIVTK